MDKIKAAALKLKARWDAFDAKAQKRLLILAVFAVVIALALICGD